MLPGHCQIRVHWAPAGRERRLAVIRQLANFVQRRWWTTGSNAAPSSLRLDTDGPWQICAQKRREAALGNTACSLYRRVMESGHALSERLSRTQHNARLPAASAGFAFGLYHASSIIRVPEAGLLRVIAKCF